MPTDKLTDSKCKAAKPREKPYKLFDGDGMALWVSPTGAKAWRLYYRVGGKQKTMSLGGYPDVPLAAAREKREEARAALRGGADPMAPRRKAPSLREAAETYFAGRRDLSPSYLANAKRALEMHVYPRLGSRPVDSLSRQEVLDTLGVMDAQGLHVYVRKTRMWLGQVFDHAMERGHCGENPCASINPRKAFGVAKVEHFASVELPEVPALMQRLALENPDLQSVLACRFMAYTWVRTTEMRGMPWSELDGDLWRIKGERMKKARDHLVPLPRQAQAILALMQRRCRGSAYVWPSDHRVDRPMSENAVLYLLHRIGYKGRMTGHGWRSVASTWANERGYGADAVERQLAHAPDDQVRAVYNRALYLPERARMLQAWADWLDEVEAGGAQR